jgi:predicted transcriptional regulator
VNKIAGTDICKCPCKTIDTPHQKEYKRLLDKQLIRKNAQKSAIETRKRSSDEYLAGASAAYATTQKKKSRSTSPFPHEHFHHK